MSGGSTLLKLVEITEVEGGGWNERIREPWLGCDWDWEQNL